MALADRSPQERRAEEAGACDALWLGVAQACSLIPGVSRNGATLAAARWRRFTRVDANRLSRHAALPIIAGATLLKGMRLRARGLPPGAAVPFAAGAAGRVRLDARLDPPDPGAGARQLAAALRAVPDRFGGADRPPAVPRGWVITRTRRRPRSSAWFTPYVPESEFTADGASADMSGPRRATRGSRCRPAPPAPATRAPAATARPAPAARAGRTPRDLGVAIVPNRRRRPRPTGRRRPEPPDAPAATAAAAASEVGRPVHPVHRPVGADELQRGQLDPVAPSE